MKCFEITKCSEKDRETCFVWNSFRETPEDMNEVKCWVLKGVYQAENRKQLSTCQKCKYYLLMNRESGVVSDYDADVAIITLDNVLNNDRTKALEKVWGTVLENGKTLVLIRMENVNNVYSCGLGMLIKIHKEAQAAGGMAVVEGAHGYVMTVLESTKLNRILHLASDMAQARELFAQFREKIERPVEPEGVAEESPKERPPCHAYWNNHNPRNATNCDECFRKIKPSDDPCWIVEGVIEGVSFQYVNEDCEDCPYFQEFGRSQSPQT